MKAGDRLVLAVPKGRILNYVAPLMARAGIEPEAEFFDPGSRRLSFAAKDSSATGATNATGDPGIEIIRVRSFDTATFLAFGAAHMAICGEDVLMEFSHPEICAPVDLDVGHCRLAVAAPAALAASEDPRRWSHLRVATKYPNITRRHFAARGVQAECIKLNGAMELAPGLGLCRRIVDLVDSGATLAANGLVEVEQIARITSRLAVNRAALKTRPDLLAMWIERFREAARAA